jgi:hypothetical protein
MMTSPLRQSILKSSSTDRIRSAVPDCGERESICDESRCIINEAFPFNNSNQPSWHAQLSNDGGRAAEASGGTVMADRNNRNKALQ